MHCLSAAVTRRAFVTHRTGHNARLYFYMFANFILFVDLSNSCRLTVPLAALKTIERCKMMPFFRNVVLGAPSAGGRLGAISQCKQSGRSPAVMISSINCCRPAGMFAADWLKTAAAAQCTGMLLGDSDRRPSGQHCAGAMCRLRIPN